MSSADQKSGNARLLAIGGGKGGVGKSFISSSVAVAIAQAGHTVTIVDLDLGGANLHSIFGLKTTDTGIGDYIYRPVSNDLADYAVDVGVKNLRLISGNGFIPGIANIEFQRKVKVIRALSTIDSEYVIMDLGAGTSFNVIDFFTITKSGVIVTMHEPTAILNAYEFLKNVLFRIYSRDFKDEKHVISVINKFKTSDASFEGGNLESLIEAVEKSAPESGKKMREIHNNFQPAFVVNMTRENVHDFTKSLKEICTGYLSIKLQCLEGIPDDPKVKQCCVSMTPFLLKYPDSSIATKLRAIAEACMKSSWMDASRVEDTAAGDESEDDATPEPTTLTSVIQGRPDSELPSLLSDFLKESSDFVASDKTEDQAQSPEDDTGLSESDLSGASIDGLDVPMGEGLPSVRYPVAPRMRPDAEFPYFAMPSDDKAASGLLGRLMGKIQGPDNQFTQAFEEIRKNPKSRDTALSMRTLTQQAENTPEMGIQWLKTGMALIAAHQIPLAQQAFENAQFCLPKDEIAMNNWAASLIVMGKLGQAIKLLQNGVREHKNSLAICFNLGLAYIAQKQFKEACATFTKARSMAHGDMHLPSDFLEGYSHCRLGDFNSAETVFKSLAERESQDLYTAFNLGLVRVYAGNYTEALKAFNVAVAGSPSDVDSLVLRGLCHMNAGNPEKALSDLSKAIRFESSNVAIYMVRAAVAQQANRLDLAVSDIQAITRLLPGNKSFRRLLMKIRSEIEGV